MGNLTKQEDSRLFITCFSLIIILSCWIRTKDLFLIGTFWCDEAMLADNIISRGFIKLCKPLDWFQVAPLGYLWIEKIIAFITGYTDFGFRLLSYIIGVSIPPLFYLISDKMCKDRIVSFTISISVCLNQSLIHYSTELKPYILDVMLGLFFILIHNSKEKTFYNTKYHYILGTFFIFGAFFFSYFFILAASLIVYQCFFVNWSTFKKIYMIFIEILITGIAYFIIAYNHPYSEFMVTFWENEFIHISEGFVNAFKTLYWKILIGLKFFFNSNTPELLFFILLIFIFILLFNRFKLIFWLGMPVIIHISLAFLGKYPIVPRLYLLWLIYIFLLIVIAIDCLKNRFLRYAILTIILVLIIPWRIYPAAFYTTSTKCFLIERLKKIPDQSIVYVSESLVPVINLETKRGTLSGLKGIKIIKGSGLINNKLKTSQTYGLSINKENTIAKEINAINESNLYIMLHLHNYEDIVSLIKELNVAGNINVVECQSVIKSSSGLFDVVLKKNNLPLQ